MLILNVTATTTTRNEEAWYESRTVGTRRGLNTLRSVDHLRAEADTRNGETKEEQQKDLNLRGIEEMVTMYPRLFENARERLASSRITNRRDTRHNDVHNMHHADPVAKHPLTFGSIDDTMSKPKGSLGSKWVANAVMIEVTSHHGQVTSQVARCTVIQRSSSQTQNEQTGS